MPTRGALRARLALLDELRQIVQVMRNLAFAELERCLRMQAAAQAARDTVLQALEDLGAAPPARPRAAPVWFVIGAGRGFCGAFDARLAAQVREQARSAAPARLVVAGERLAATLAEAPAATPAATPAGLGPVAAVPGCASLEEAGAVLEAWLQALGPDLERGAVVELVQAGAGGWLRRPLWPEPGQPAPRAPAPNRPADGAVLRGLPVAVLAASLRRQALRLVLHAALRDSLELENRDRLAQMQRAQDHLDELRGQVRRRHAALRQAEITNELQTLMSALLPGPAG